MPAKSKMYLDVLAKMTELDVDEMGVNVRTIRQTKKGGVLVELVKTDPKVLVQFEKAIMDVVGNDASGKTIIPQLTVEIRNGTSTSTKEEVEAAIKKSLGTDTPDTMELWLSPTGLRGTRLASVSLTELTVHALAGHGHIQIGWVVCPVRIKDSSVRCYRYFGHRRGSTGCRAR